MHHSHEESYMIKLDDERLARVREAMNEANRKRGPIPVPDWLLKTQEILETALNEADPHPVED